MAVLHHAKNGKQLRKYPPAIGRNPTHATHLPLRLVLWNPHGMDLMPTKFQTCALKLPCLAFFVCPWLFKFRTRPEVTLWCYDRTSRDAGRPGHSNCVNL